MKLGSITQAIREEISKLNQGIASTGRRGEKDDAGTAQDISGGQETNRSRTEKEVGENQASKEVTPSLFRIDFFPALVVKFHTPQD